MVFVNDVKVAEIKLLMTPYTFPKWVAKRQQPHVDGLFREGALSASGPEELKYANFLQYLNTLPSWLVIVNLNDYLVNSYPRVHCKTV